MNSAKKKILVLIPVILFILFFSSININVNNVNNSTQIYKETKDFNVKSSGFWNLTGSPIYIDDIDPANNWSKTASENDWCSGYGNSTHPYVIEDVLIDGQGSGTCIEIKNSDVYFRIENCTLFNAEIGINIYNSTENSQISDVIIFDLVGSSGSYPAGVGGDCKGIMIDICVNITITTNIIENSSAGIGGTGLAGSASAGGKGGIGGVIYGISVQDSNNINVFNNNISKLIGGKGGTGGTGDVGNILHWVGYKGGTGGDGGKSYGIFCTESAYINISHNELDNIEGGMGGLGGTGGSGGIWGSEGGGTGGNGGIGYGVYGSYFINSSINSNEIVDFTGGTGGTGGNSGPNSGPRGNGGTGGWNIGTYLILCSNITFDSNFIVNILEGAGGSIGSIYTGGSVGSNGIGIGSGFNNINSSQIINNYISNTGKGLHFYECNSSLVFENNISYCLDEGLFMDSINYFNNISNNIISNNTEYGIRLSEFNNGPVIDNVIVNTNCGFYLGSGTDFTILPNTITNAYQYGYRFGTLNNYELSGFTLDGCDYAVYIAAGNNVTITNLNTNYCGYGIYLGAGTNVSISANTLYNNTQFGIWVDSLNEGEIINNIINISRGGIYLGAGTGFTILPNTITNAYQYGYRFGTLNNYELSGFTLDGCDYAVYIAAGNNVTITNLNTNYCGYSIYLDTGNNVSINANTFYNNTQFGIWVNTLNEGEIINNNINICQGGIYLGTGSDFTILPNTITNAYQYGYRFGTLNNFILSGFALEGCDYAVYIATGNNLTITDVETNYCGCGVYIGTGDNITIYNNRLNENSLYGIKINDNVNNTRIYGNVANYSTYGFYIGIGQNNSFHDNIAKYNDYGVYLFGVGMSTYNVSIFRNIAQYNDECNMYLESIFYINIANDDFIYSDNYGLYLKNCNNITIMNNNFSLNQNHGIYLQNSDYNNITCNIISNNPGIGITLVDSGSGSNYNLIYNNTFENNGFNAFDDASNNNWNTSMIGNYWGSYGGVDANDDGVGDTPYDEILGIGNAKDYIPIWWDAPTISIEGFISHSFYSGGLAPDYLLHILEGKGDYAWYTITETAETFMILLSHSQPESINGTINQGIWDNFSNGTYTVRFQVNDSRGYISILDIIIHNDIIEPSITINQPIYNQHVGINALDLSFNVTINEPNIDTAWINIDNGKINSTFIWKGEIDQEIWETIWNSTLNLNTITITFYVNDSAGNQGFASIFVIKEISTSVTGGDDLGFWLLIIIILSVITASIIGSVLYISRKKKAEQTLIGPIKKKSLYGFRDRIEYLKEITPPHKGIKSSIDKKLSKSVDKAPITDKGSKGEIIIEEVEEVENIDIISAPPLTDSELIENILKSSQKDVEFINNGKRFEVIGNFKEAIKCYDQAIQANPKNVDAWLYKGKALEELGEFEKANECIDKIYELKKDK